MPSRSAKISAETRAAVLDAAWALMAGQKRLDAGMAEIAQAAGVSRQTLFLAFGNRAGLLVAMARHRDTQGDHIQRLRSIAMGEGNDSGTLHACIDAWVDYLPWVYPVAIQLETASLSDPDAAAAWQDRIFGQGLRLALDLVLARLGTAGALGNVPPPQAADLVLTWLVPSAWRYLVIERGWTPEAFAASRHALLRSFLAAPAAMAPGHPTT